MSYILALDQGTSSTKAIVFNEDFYEVASAQEDFQQIYPNAGWVEHNPDDLVHTTMNVIEQAVTEAGLFFKDIKAIGITNQRETVVAWDANTGKPLHNAIVWQCRRTSERSKILRKEHLDFIQSRTGLIPDPYFSATKMEWLIKNVPEVERAAREKSLRFGTVDSWLAWNLSRHREYVTDVSNASRTMLYNITDHDWDRDLLDFFGIMRESLPDVVHSSEVIGESVFGPPIAGVAGDQQSSLFGQTAFEPGETKCTYGTGSFILMNTGDKPCFSHNGLLTTVAWGLDGKTCYAVEGSIFATGALISWLKNEIGLISSAEETESLARSVENSNDVYFAGALTGLGAPYWDPSARGLLIGFTRGTTKAHVVRAVLDYIAFRTRELVELMIEDTGIGIKKLLVDGGVTRNNFLMQLQSDVLGAEVDRSAIRETTALGAAMLAGLGLGLWSMDELKGKRRSQKRFSPGPKRRDSEYYRWKEALKRSMNWVQ